MNRLQGQLINRRASIVQLRALRAETGLNAHIAGWWVTDWVVNSQEDFDALVSAINADLSTLDEDQEAFRLVGQAGINDRIKNGKCYNKISPTTGFNDCLSASDIKFQAWYGAFNGFKEEWQNFLANNPGPSDTSVAKQKALRLSVLRSDYEKISKRKLAVSAAPKESPSGGGGFGGLGGSADSLNSLVWIVGIGFAFFVVMTALAPLLAATARTKEQFRQVRG